MTITPFIQPLRPLIFSDTLIQYSMFNNDKIYGDWTIEGKSYYLQLRKLIDIINVTPIQEFDLIDIAWKGFNLGMDKRGINCPCCAGDKYVFADTAVPGLLIEGYNVYGKRYRCIDGKHRIEALLSYNMKHGLFGLLNFSDIKPYLLPIL